MCFLPILGYTLPARWLSSQPQDIHNSDKPNAVKHVDDDAHTYSFWNRSVTPMTSAFPASRICSLLFPLYSSKEDWALGCVQHHSVRLYTCGVKWTLPDLCVLLKAECRECLSLVVSLLPAVCFWATRLCFLACNHRVPSGSRWCQVNNLFRVVVGNVAPQGLFILMPNTKPLGAMADQTALSIT